MTIAVQIQDKDVSVDWINKGNNKGIFCRMAHLYSGASVIVGPGGSKIKLKQKAMAKLQEEIYKDSY